MSSILLEPFQSNLLAGPLMIYFSLIVHEELVCTLHSLIRPVSRMDGLAGTSLKPIRCTERETACPSSVMLHVVMAVREHRAALYPQHACMLLFLCTLSHVLLNPSLPSVPSVDFFHPPLHLFLSLSSPCLHCIRSHVWLSCCPSAERC